MLVWPDRDTVDLAVRSWARIQLQEHPELVRLGYFGSYATGKWGVGSDVDLVAIVSEADAPFERRALRWDFELLPVPAEIMVYDETEWRRLQEEGGAFAQMLCRETQWVISAAADPPSPPR
ncbi:MAG: nucleotidyltransferase domain-containing protein [Candidatus Krumholzibacteriia bacterium]